MPVAQESIQTTVFDSLVEFGAEAGEVTLEATFEALDVDSLDIAELGQIIEEKYGVEIKGADIEKIRTVGDLVVLIAARA
jgi:acyl carrier protein